MIEALSLDMFTEPVAAPSFSKSMPEEGDRHARLDGRMLHAWIVTVEGGQETPTMHLFPWTVRKGRSYTSATFELPEGWTAQPEETAGRLLITADEDYMTLADAVRRGHARRVS